MTLVVTAVHTFVAEHGDELEFKAGEKIEVIEKDEAFGDGWWKGRNAKGEEGLFPATYIEDPNAIASGATDVPNAEPSEGPIPLPPSPKATPPPTAADPSTNGNGVGLASPFTAGREAEKPQDESRNSLLDATGAPHSSASAPKAGGNVMGYTIGEVQEVIDTMNTTPKGGVQLKDPQDTTRDVTAANDNHDEDEVDGPIGIGSDMRARLAEQAKLANEERDRQRESGPVADLVYSDESDDEEDESHHSTYSRRANGSNKQSSISSMIKSPEPTIPAVEPTVPETLELADPVPDVPPVTAITPAEPDMRERAATELSKPGTGLGPALYPQGEETTSAAEHVPETASTPHADGGVIGAVAGTAAAVAAGAVGIAATQREQVPDSTAAEPTETVVPPAPAQESIPTPGTRTSSLQASPALGSVPLAPVSEPTVKATPPMTSEHTSQLEPAISLPATPQQPVMSSTPGSAGPNATPSTTATPSTNAALAPTTPPATWSVEEVAEWARSKGFDESICAKFIEHDISGDVLLELDANLLKELDIRQFGKRVRIAHAIDDLRRPRGAEGIASLPPNGSDAPAKAGSQTRYVAPPTSFPTHSVPATQTETSTLSSSGSPVLGADTKPHSQPKAHELPSAYSTPPMNQGPSTGEDHHTAWSHGRKVSMTPSTQPIDESRVVNHSGTGTPNGTTSGAGERATRTSMSTPASPANVAAAGGAAAVGVASAAVVSSLVKRESTGSLTHKKNRSTDKSDRLSFFGRNRKPAPERQASSGSPLSPASERSGSRIGFGSKPTKEVNVSEAERRASSGASIGSNPPAGAAMRQIGKPDKTGYLKKKGERYNTWKTRFFVLKGSHLYYLKSESEDKVKGHIDLKGHRIIVDENNPGSYGFRLVGPTDTKPYFFSWSDQTIVRDWMKAIMKATIARDYSVPVTSSCNIPTIPLSEAQALQPRPPSPAAREATQRANRRDNVNQLTPRDASVLMSLDTTSSAKRITSHTNSLAPAPSRPSRDTRRSVGRPSVSSYYAPENEQQAGLLEWVNRVLPTQYPRAAQFPNSFISGEVIFLIVKHLSGIEPKPPVPSSAFAPDSTGLPNVEGLFAMMDCVIDAGIDSAGVSLNDVRAGEPVAITNLLESVRGWARSKGVA